MEQYDPVISVVNAITATGRRARKQGKEFKCQCPAHDDKQASLQVGRGLKGAVLHCHAGCKTPDIMAALQLPMIALFDNYYEIGGEHHRADEPAALRDPAKGALATYIYDDENGKVLFRVERKRNKQFVQARPNPAKVGDWIYNLGESRRVPFRLANVVSAVRDEVPVYVVEGEKDVLTLEPQGFVATTNPGGAGKFSRDYVKYFTGGNVVILPDNDEPGREHADQVALFLKDAARTVKVVELPGPDKSDVTDWFKRKGNDAAKLKELVDATEPRYSNRPVIFHAAELMAERFEEVTMAVPGVIAEGLTFLVGAPKIGKSWMSLGLGLAVASGGMALGAIPVREGPCLYLALEDTPRRLQRRLSVMLGDVPPPTNLNFACGWPRLGAGGLDQLEAWMKKVPDARMVIIDTWAKVKSSMADSDQSLYDSDYSAVSAVKALADTYGTAIVFVHHQRKAGDQDPLNTVAGSTGLTGSADAIVVLTRPRGSEEGHLYVTGRDVEESRSILSFDGETGSWIYVGEAETVEEQRTEDQVLRLLANSAADGQGPLGPKEIAQALDMKEGTAKWLCAKLATENKISRLSRGKYTTNEAAVANAVGGPVTPVGPGPIVVQSVQPPIPGSGGKTVPGPLISVSDEEIEALLADDDGFGGLDDDDNNGDGE